MDSSPRVRSATRPRMLGRHWLNQRGELLAKLGTARSGGALNASEAAEPLPMPVEQGVGFEHHLGLVPRAKTALEQQEGETVPPDPARFLDWALHAPRSEWRAAEDLLDQALGLGAGDSLLTC